MGFDERATGFDGEQTDRSPARHITLQSTMTLRQDPPAALRRDSRIALYSIVGFWSFYFLINSVRSLVLQDPDQVIDLGKRVVVASAEHGHHRHILSVHSRVFRGVDAAEHGDGRPSYSPATPAIRLFQPQLVRVRSGLTSPLIVGGAPPGRLSGAAGPSAIPDGRPGARHTRPASSAPSARDLERRTDGRGPRPLDAAEGHRRECGQRLFLLRRLGVSDVPRRCALRRGGAQGAGAAICAGPAGQAAQRMPSSAPCATR